MPKMNISLADFTCIVAQAHSVCQSRTVKLNLPREMFCSLVEQWRRTIADDGVAWRHPRLSPAVANVSNPTVYEHVVTMHVDLDHHLTYT